MSESTEYRRARIKFLLELYHRHPGATPLQLHALGVQEDDVQLLQEVVQRISESWMTFQQSLKKAAGVFDEAATTARDWQEILSMVTTLPPEDAEAIVNRIWGTK